LAHHLFVHKHGHVCILQCILYIKCQILRLVTVDAKHGTTLVCEWGAFVLKQNIERKTWICKSKCCGFEV